MEKMEQIGKAVLDYRFYPEDDKYTDGAIEDEMLEIARNCAPEQYERVIVEKKSWPILYHFSYLRENIFRCLPMDVSENVVEIGAGPGAITGALCEKARQVTVKTVGYTGWKLVAVVPSTTLWDNYGQLILFFLFVVLFSVYLLIFVNLRLSGWITAPVKKLDREVKALEAGEQVADFNVGGPYEVEHLSHSIESMVSTLRHLMDDIIEQEKQKRRSELDVLQAQINPHFLYNTLDSVVWMTENGRTEDAVVMLTSLARFFRISLSRGSSVIPIADELEHARHYLTIQKMRYKNKFSADIQAEDGVEQL